MCDVLKNATEMSNSRAEGVALALSADARALHPAHDAEFRAEGKTVHVWVAGDHGVTLHLSPVDDQAQALVVAANEGSDYVTEALGAKGVVWPQCPMHPARIHSSRSSETRAPSGCALRPRRWWRRSGNSIASPSLARQHAGSVTARRVVEVDGIRIRDNHFHHATPRGVRTCRCDLRANAVWSAATGGAPLLPPWSRRGLMVV